MAKTPKSSKLKEAKKGKGGDKRSKQTADKDADRSQSSSSSAEKGEMANARCSASPSASTVASWRDQDTHLEIGQPEEGFLYSISLVAKVDLPPDEVYAILTSPDNHRVFSSIKAIKDRKVLEDRHGRQTVEQVQIGRWRMGLLRGVFSSHLLVHQDSHARVVSYKLKTPGFMKDFAGSWEVQPFDQESLDDLVNHKHASPLHRMQVSLHRLEERLLGHRPTHSLVRLRQSMAPALVPPPPLDKMVARVAAKQVLTIMHDLRHEAERINRAKQEGREHAPPPRSSSTRRLRLRGGGGGDDEDEVDLDAFIKDLPQQQQQAYSLTDLSEK